MFREQRGEGDDMAATPARALFASSATAETQQSLFRAFA